MSAQKQRLVLWGAGGHARVVADIVRLEDRYELVGVLDDLDTSRHGSDFCGSKILGGAECLPRLRSDGIEHVLVAIGNCRARAALGARAIELGFSLGSAIHPRATIARDVVLGAGTVIAAGAVVNPGSRIGIGVIVNTSASVDHDCALGDAVHVAPGSRIAGGVSIGAGAWVGIGSTVIENTRIGANVMLGAGSLVLKDLPPNVVAWGTPAKIQRPNP